jgi:D-sedoheptulose 7-phosphate isomerase
MNAGVNHAGLLAVAEDQFRKSIDLPRDFFTAEAKRVAQVCLEMARRFQRGGRLLAFAAGNAASDAQHVSVEFVHPVIVGKRALPAVALGTDLAGTLALARDLGWQEIYSRQLETLGKEADIALGIDFAGDDPAVMRGLAAARRMKMLTIGLSGAVVEAMTEIELDYHFAVPAEDVNLVQEIHETLYHILWEQVHVFFEHKGLLDA